VLMYQIFQFPLLSSNCVSAFYRRARVQASGTSSDRIRDHLGSPAHREGSFMQLMTPTVDYPHRDGCFCPHSRVLP